MKILGDVGKNKHGQRVVRVECLCGNIFEAIYNNVKRGRTKSCGHCGKSAKECKPKSAPIAAQNITPSRDPEIKSQFERGTPAWFDEQIASKEAAALTLEKQATSLEAEMKQNGITSWSPGDEPAYKQWNAATTTAHKLRLQIARLQIEKANAETAAHKDTRTQAEITRDKIAALRGSK
jgi:hypothetical protein